MALTKFKQIDGGAQLLEDVKNLKNAGGSSSVSLTTSIRQDGTADDTKAPSEKAVADILADMAVSRIMDKLTLEAQSTTTPITTFTLTYKPTANKVLMNLNHLMYTEDEDFNVDRDTKTVTWTATAENGGIDITTKDFQSVIFIYDTKEA